MNWLYYLFTASLLFSSNQIPGLDQKRPILLKGGTIHTMTGDILEGYDLLFAKGKIISIDEEIQPSPETDVYDVYEKHIVPGYIAAHTRIGLTEISAVKQTNDHSETGDYNPNTRANVSYNPDSDLITVTRSNGILIANSVPSSGRISGQSSVMLLDGWTWEDATIKHPGGLNLNWPNMRINYNPNAKKKEKEQKEDYKKSIRELDNFIRDVRAYHQRRTVRERRAEDKQLSDLRLESMVHYVIDKNPIHVKANDIRQIEAAINWAKKHNLKIVIVGGRDSWMNTDLLIRENIPVILTTIQTTPRRRHEPIHLPYKVPSLLQKAGVQFCISTDYGYPLDGHVRTLPNEAMRAVTWGLTKQEAMRAITLSAAEILGIDDLVGSLEPGKDATFFISETDPMLIETNPVKAYIRGREVDLSDRQKMLWEKYREKYKRMGKLLK